MHKLIEQVHAVKGLDPVADAFAGTVATDVFALSEGQEALFVIHKGVGATGTSVITVEACDDVTPSNTSAVPFVYKAITTGDTHGALTQATASGFTLTAGSSQLYLVSVDAAALLASGYKYVRLKAVESVNDPVLAGIVALVHGLRYVQAHNSLIV